MSQVIARRRPVIEVGMGLSNNAVDGSSLHLLGSGPGQAHPRKGFEIDLCVDGGSVDRPMPKDIGDLPETCPGAQHPTGNAMTKDVGSASPLAIPHGATQHLPLH